EGWALAKGSGVSMAVVLIASQTPQGTKITQHKVPMEGGLYAKNIKELFPERYYNSIFLESTEEYNKRAARLMNETETQAAIYYKLK
ncbi:MAG: hypothetical protein ACP5GW_03785, partial [Caldisericaceae bacterium]